MQFIHPEVLYALFLLIIPLLVHLFQLRRFRKESFTNVKFLKRLTDQTRKSSKLKKWLVLATRLLLLTSVILAFAQPYIPTETATDPQDLDTVIYLDNSYSMQAQGQKGRLLERSVQELLEALPEEGNVSLITNTEEYSPVTKSDLQQIEYSASQPDLQTIFLKAGAGFSKNQNKRKNLLLISDFQEHLRSSSTEIPSGIEIKALALRPERLENAKIDTAFISQSGLGNKILHVQISYVGNSTASIPVSLHNGEQLLGKSSAEIAGGEISLLEFPLDEQEISNGVISIEDAGLQFDNSLYFSLNNLEPINVVSINAASDNFLKRIYSGQEFNYTAMDNGSIDYNSLSAARVIILNQVEELSPSLLGNLQGKAEQQSIIIAIPSPDEIGNNYRSFLKNIGFPGVGNKQYGEKLITEISFDHPVFSDVFEEKTRNFEYPRVQVTYKLMTNSSPLLRYQDQEPFLAQNNGHFLFTAPLDQENSNFHLSPLVVPTFYNMGISALRPPNLYYSLNKINQIDIPVALQEDKILQLASNDVVFIPQQQNSPNKVTITLDELPEKPGNYSILKDGENIMSISLNIPSKESNLNYLEISNKSEMIPVESISGFFTTSGFNKEVETLWKWFVIVALILLLIETLLLKFLK